MYKQINDDTLILSQQAIYGSSRLGVLEREEVVSIDSTIHTQTPTIPDPLTEHVTHWTRGHKRYELTNHLGNVLATVSDRKLPVYANNSFSYYKAEVMTANDYYAFGMVEPKRGFDTSDYRFGFNGKERVNELWGNGNTYDYGFRILNAQLCRFLSVDPLTKSYPWYTPFQFAGNKPIIAIDIDGLEELVTIRWFDGDKYKGSTSVRVADASQRDAGHRRGGDMQLIEMDASQRNQFDTKADSKNISAVSNLIKNADGNFKGQYLPALSKSAEFILKGLRESDSKNTNALSIPTIRTESVMFEDNSEKIRVNISGETLNRIKNTLAADPDRVLDITGFASLENETGNPNHNVELSQKRANAVTNFLVDNGISKDRILSTTGAGATDQFKQGNSEEDRTQNRRAEITYTYKKTKTK